MRIKMAIAGAAVMALALPLTAAAGNGDKATGGGQFDVGENAGNTIGFTAQKDGEGSAAKGQVQIIDRSEGKGQDQTRFHGVVTCMEAWTDNDRGFAIVGGYNKADARSENKEPFTLIVQDGGEPNRGNDGVYFERNETADCDEPDEPNSAGNLGRGNIQIRDTDGGGPSGEANALSAAGIL